MYVCKPGDKKAKLDDHTSNDIFVGYTSTIKNIYYIDNTTSVIKIGDHTLFDEAHFTSPRLKQPIAAQVLQTLGYSAFSDRFKNGKFKPRHTIRITRVHKHVIQPTQVAPRSIAYTLHTCTDNRTIEPS